MMIQKIMKGGQASWHQDISQPINDLNIMEFIEFYGEDGKIVDLEFTMK